ncbi:MAG: hypothetical protein JWN04_165 [Myxococcaceae bacterium]|nr:hypothetical protein [Myxococcaceae bacterium]
MSETDERHEQEPASAAKDARVDAVVTFWRDAGWKRWFSKDAGFDADFRARFLSLHEEAAAGTLESWTASAHGALALLILLDQFPRNAFRGTSRMFATDALARRYANDAIAAGHDRQVGYALRAFFYLPFEHSEELGDQDRSLALNHAPELEKYAREHRDIIVRFGRFPHRNALLGRASTPDELAFLEAGGFAG